MVCHRVQPGTPFISYKLITTRSVRVPHAEGVRDASAVAGHRPGGFGFLTCVRT
jgi:hypothetical protein